MSRSPITVEQFTKRLVDLCVRGGPLAGFPRLPRDRHILLKSIARTLQPGQDYSEQEINAALLIWLSRAASALSLDHITLRRQMVVDGYLDRAANGSRYRLCLPPANDVVFEPGVEAADIFALVDEARAAMREQKRRYLARGAGPGAPQGREEGERP